VSLRTQLIALMISEPMQSFRRSLSELRRRLTGQPHTVSVFLELDDPYSYLLSQYLPCFAESYDIELRLYLTQACGEGYRPRADMLARYAEKDCERVARELGVPFLDNGQAPPVEYRRAVIDTLAHRKDSDQFGDELLECIGLYWRGDTEAIARRVSDAVVAGEGEGMLAENQQRLIRLGHYNTAMLYYGGEWYWGVDRLHYLTGRLDALGLRKAAAATARLTSIRQVMQASLPVAAPSATQDLPPLEYFCSFRSPYSYLSMRRVFAIADAFGLELKVRPVLPMVTRGMQVPKPKLMYIGGDASREARRLEVPFGKFRDPLGRGIERCMAVYYYALAEKRGRDFLVNAGEAIWARGIDLATDKGMRKVTGRTGLFWPDVLKAMQNESWRQEVEENRASMEESGSWGVPTMRMGGFVTWGQDRDWLLVRHIEELCDTGDGILI
jgi:2-hydroxychromene-2-carboxylate isomerase